MAESLRTSSFSVAPVHEIAGSGDKLFSINNVRYLAPYSVEDREASGEPDYSLVTVFQAPEGSGQKITETWIRDFFRQYECGDDVFQAEFLATVILSATGKGTDLSITDDARDFLQSKGTQRIHIFPPGINGIPLLPGPYVVVQNRLRDVWRIYDDTFGTFMTAFRPQVGVFVELKLVASKDTFRAIALSSRIKTGGLSSDLLRGLRIAVKDNYHLKDIRTSLGSRSYYETYGPSLESADSVQTLIDRGASVVGKLKLTSFGVWEEPIQDIDYQAPWNPRADGFQSPGGSSSGPASALAAYDWLHVTLGSDASGSVMRPALWCGVFGLRPTFEAVSPKGIPKFIEYFDMPGCFTRDLLTMRDFATLWLDQDRLTKQPKPFTSVMFATDMWRTIDSNQCKIAREFVKDLELHLKLTCFDCSFEEEWAKSPPQESGGSSLSEYMNKAIHDIFYEALHRLDDFVETHMEKFGVPPYFSPPNAEIWNWFWNTVLEGDTSHKLLILPIENLSPRYRDEWPNFQRPPPGVNSLFLSPVMKAPELIVPIGEIPYHSKITAKEEKLPFSIGLMSLPGSDLMLISKILDVLRDSGRATRVRTGKSMF